MENFLVAAAGLVGQAVAQEVVSRTVTSVLGKRKAKASQGDCIERLEAAVRCMRSVLETTAKAPITEVSLLRDRIELERGYMEARGVLNKHKKRQQEITTQAITTHSSSGGSPQAQGTSVAGRTTIFSIASSSFFRPMKAEPSRLSCDDIERFERLAGSARDFLGMVSRCASLRHRIYFSGPLVSHLFQRETLAHKTLEGSREHCFRIWPMIFEGRGVEAELQYTYTHHERTDKSFDLKLHLRLSPSTDIAQVAIKCLQSLAVKCPMLGLLEPATGALLQLASSQDIVSHAPRWRDPQCASHEEKYMKITQLCRPNPVCCTAAYGYDDEPCAQESQFFPEEIISLGVRCCISGLELTLPSPSDTTGASATVFGDQPPQMNLSGLFVPHFMKHVMASDIMLEGREVLTFDTIAGERSERVDCRIQEAAEKAILDLFRLGLHEFRSTFFVEYVPHMLSEGSLCLPKDYQMSWLSKHGAACFRVHDAVRDALSERGRVAFLSRLLLCIPRTLTRRLCRSNNSRA